MLWTRLRLVMLPQVLPLLLPLLEGQAALAAMGGMDGGVVMGCRMVSGSSMPLPQ